MSARLVQRVGVELLSLAVAPCAEGVVALVLLCFGVVRLLCCVVLWSGVVSGRGRRHSESALRFFCCERKRRLHRKAAQHFSSFRETAPQ